MSETVGEPGGDPIQELARSIAGFGLELVRKRDFMGHKVAREVMDEWDLSGSLDDTGDAALAEMFGTCVTTGIVLGMQGKTDEASVQEAVERLYGDLPASLAPTMGRVIQLLIPRGVAFYENDLSQNSPKVQAWTAEFDLLRGSES